MVNRPRRSPWLGLEAGDPPAANEPAAVPTPAAVGVAEDGIVVGTGVGSEKVRGVQRQHGNFPRNFRQSMTLGGVP